MFPQRSGFIERIAMETVYGMYVDSDLTEGRGHYVLRYIFAHEVTGRAFLESLSGPGEIREWRDEVSRWPYSMRPLPFIELESSDPTEVGEYVAGLVRKTVAEQALAKLN